MAQMRKTTPPSKKTTNNQPATIPFDLGRKVPHVHQAQNATLWTLAFGWWCTR